MNEQNDPTPEHYRKTCPKCSFSLDPYRISEIYGHSGIQHHLTKKALCTGKRGHKDLVQDLEDIIATATRWKQMIEEDQDKPVTAPAPSSGFAVGRRVRVSFPELSFHGRSGEILKAVPYPKGTWLVGIDSEDAPLVIHETNLELLPEEPAAPQAGGSAL